MSELRALIARVEKQLDQVDEQLGQRPNWQTSDYATCREYDVRKDKAMAALRERLTLTEGASFSQAGAHDHAIRMGGFRTTSTSGWSGAFTNWLAAARKRLATCAEHPL